MKRPFLGVIAVGVLAILGAVPKASAHWWWWHHHSNQQAAGAGATAKHSKWHGHNQGMAKPVALYAAPKSMGWWHKYPGPMGAGGEQVAMAQPKHTDNAKPQESAQNTTAPPEQSAVAQAAPAETVNKPEPAKAQASAQPQESAQNNSKHHSLFGWLHRHHNQNATAAQPSTNAAPATASATNSDQQ